MPIARVITASRDINHGARVSFRRGYKLRAGRMYVLARYDPRALSNYRYP